MGKNCKWMVTDEQIAVGIKGDRHSLCGAIKKFELRGAQSNGLLSLKEQCARRIALIKNEHLKCFLIAYLTPDLFRYVTKDIFDLKRRDLTSKLPKPLYMCQECTMDTYEDRPEDCRCPRMDAAIEALNSYLFKEKDDDCAEKKQFQLVYKIPNDEQDHSYELRSPTSFFLHLEPVQHSASYDQDSFQCDGSFEKYKLLNGRISAEDKLLFVDAMRFFGGFKSYVNEPELIFYSRREFYL